MHSNVFGYRSKHSTVEYLQSINVFLYCLRLFFSTTFSFIKFTMNDSFEELGTGMIEEIKRPEDYSDNFNSAMRHRVTGVNPLNYPGRRNFGPKGDLSEDLNRNMWISSTRPDRLHSIASPAGINSVTAAPIASYRSFMIIPACRTHRPAIYMLSEAMRNPNPSLSQQSPFDNRNNRLSDWLTDEEQEEIAYQSSSKSNRRSGARPPYSANRISGNLLQPHRRNRIGEQKRRYVRR